MELHSLEAVVEQVDKELMLRAIIMQQEAQVVLEL